MVKDRKIFSDVEAIKSTLNKIKTQSISSPVSERRISFNLLFLHNVLMRFLLGILIIIFFGRFKLYIIFHDWISSFVISILSLLVSASIATLFGEIIYFYLLITFFLFALFPFSKETFTKYVYYTSLLLFLAIFLIVIYSLFTNNGVIHSNVQNNFNFGFDRTVKQIKLIANDISCAMSYQCQMREMKGNSAKTIKKYSYDLNIQFYNMYKSYELTKGQNEIDIPFKILVKTSKGADKIKLLKYECYYKIENSGFGLDGGSKEKLFYTGGFGQNSEISTFGENIELDKNCVLKDFPKNLERNTLVVTVKVYSSAITQCQYPFYLLNLDYFMKKYNIILDGNMNVFTKRAIVESKYSNYINKEFDVSNMENQFLCSNDLFKISSTTSQKQPIFFYENSNVKPFYRLGVSVSKNEFNDLGNTVSGELSLLNLPKGFNLDISKSLNVEKSGSGIVLKNNNFTSNNLNFILLFSNIEKTDSSEIRYLTLNLNGTFVKESSFTMNINNLYFANSNSSSNSS